MQQNDDPLYWLVSKGEWKRLRESKKFCEMSFEGQILTARQAVSNREEELNKMFYKVARSNPTAAGTLLQEKIKPLRNLQTALDACLMQSDTRKKGKVPKELVAVITAE